MELFKGNTTSYNLIDFNFTRVFYIIYEIKYYLFANLKIVNIFNSKTAEYIFYSLDLYFNIIHFYKLIV